MQVGWAQIAIVGQYLAIDWWLVELVWSPPNWRSSKH